MSAALRLASSRLFFFTFSTVSENAFRCSSLFKESSRLALNSAATCLYCSSSLIYRFRIPAGLIYALPVPVKYLLSHLMVQRFLKIIRSNDTINLFK